MICTGAVINAISIVCGGMIGNFVNRLFNPAQQDAVCKVCGISTVFIAIAGAMEGMLSIRDGGLHSGKAMLVVFCLAIGTVVGELAGIENGIASFGRWLKEKTGNSEDKNFINAFVTSSLTVCVGAMAIVGSIQDGISGNYYILAVKSVLDFIIIAIMTSSMGKGCIFSAIPILLFEGSITLLAGFIAPVMTELAITYLSLIGSILIFCVGLNLIREQHLRVANMLPAAIFAVIAAYLPFEL